MSRIVSVETAGLKIICSISATSSGQFLNRHFESNHSSSEQKAVMAIT